MKEYNLLERCLHLHCKTLEEACLSAKVSIYARMNHPSMIHCLPDPFERFCEACRDEGTMNCNGIFEKDTDEEYIEAYRLLYDDNYKRI